MTTANPLQPPASFYNIQIADHVLNLHSHNMQSDEDHPDVVFLIGAPAGLEPQSDAMHLYLDPANFPPRELPANAWQIRCDASIAEPAFHGWAQQCILLMIESMQGKNMMGFDFVGELGNLLRHTTGERIVVRLVPLEQAEQLSQSMAGIEVQDAWLAIFGHAPSMDLFFRTHALFEGLVHEEGRLLCSVNDLQQGEECLLLLTTQKNQ